MNKEWVYLVIRVLAWRGKEQRRYCANCAREIKRLEFVLIEEGGEASLQNGDTSIVVRRLVVRQVVTERRAKEVVVRAHVAGRAADYGWERRHANHYDRSDRPQKRVGWGTRLETV
jgi:hypothetical protein